MHFIQVIIFFVSVNEFLLLEQLTIHFVYYKEFTPSGSVRKLTYCAYVQPYPPPPFLFILTGEGTANVNYEKARYHITQLKKRFFFDNLYASMITLILVFLITETGLLQDTSSL